MSWKVPNNEYNYIAIPEDICSLFISGKQTIMFVCISLEY